MATLPVLGWTGVVSNPRDLQIGATPAARHHPRCIHRPDGFHFWSIHNRALQRPASLVSAIYWATFLRLLLVHHLGCIPAVDAHSVLSNRQGW